MTKIKIQYKSDTTLLVVSGHSGYAQNGHDIVCAAISTACIMSANLIERLDLNTNIIDLVCDEGFFRLEVKKSNFVADIVIENLIETLDELQKQYPRYIKYEN